MLSVIIISVFQCNIYVCFSSLQLLFIYFLPFPILMYSCNTEQFSKVPCLVYGFHIVPEEKIRVGRDYQAVVPELIPLSGMYYIISHCVNGTTCWHCHLMM